jgi:membrane protease YdiL (CAAX protease family)
MSAVEHHVLDHHPDPAPPTHFIQTGGKTLIPFLILAYALSWSIQVPLALQSNGLINTSLPYGLHYLSAFGPLISAVSITALFEGRAGLRQLAARMTLWRVSMVWWLIALAPLLLYMLTVVLISIFTSEPPIGNALGRLDFLPDLGWLALPFWILTFGIGEETGWRGFALPRLQRERSAMHATLILWMLWTLWHLPLFFYSYEATILPGLALGLLAGSITFTWLYNSAGGSVLILAVWHGTFNFVTACSVCKTGASSAVVSALVMTWALAIVLIFKPATLSHAEKQVD